MRNLLLFGIAVSALSASIAFAQTTTPPPTASPPAAGKMTPKATEPKTTVPAKPRTAESIECSKQADAKGLHGKERRRFRSACKKQLMKKS
jgi:psiF repeat